MQTKLLQFIFLLLTGNVIFAQQPYYNDRPEFAKANRHWIWGGGIGEVYGINFNTNPVTKLYSAANYVGIYTAISDTASGALLFFSNGDKCYNSNFSVMPNGTGLASVTTPNPTAATTQSTCLVPVIGNPDRYYLFSLQSRDAIPKLHYSIVDMTLNGGLGDVDVNNKSILLSDSTKPMGAGMIAVPGNNCDVWLLTCPAMDTLIWAYHITEAGLDTTPVISSFSKYPGLNMTFQRGSLSISPDRNTLAITSHISSLQALVSAYGAYNGQAGVIVAQFNPGTGKISNDLLVHDKIACGNGACFSPDNSKLYIFGIDSAASPFEFVSRLLQYDISTYTQASLTASKTEIGSFVNNVDSSLPPPSALRRHGDTILMSAPIYPYPGNPAVTDFGMHYIASPNLAGLSCNYVASSYIPFVNTFYNNITLGNDAVYPLPPDTTYRLALDTASCSAIVLEAPGSYSNYIWEDQSINPTRTVTNGGIYWVKYDDGGCHYMVDTFRIFGENPNPVITVNVLELGTTMPYNTYQWLHNGNIINGATNSTYTVQENGDYSVVVSNDQDCIDTSAAYTVTNSTGINDHSSYSKEIQVYPNPAHDIIHIRAPWKVNVRLVDLLGRTILRKDDIKDCSVKDLPMGTYFLMVSDEGNSLLKVEKVIKK